MPAFKFPHGVTAAERDAGVLSEERLAHLVAAGKHLRRNKSVERAAEVVGLAPTTYRTYFAELARLAGWTSRTADDFLARRETRQGGARGGHLAGKVPRTNDARDSQLHVKMTAADRALLDEALERFSGTTNDFLAEAARRSLASPKPW
jgi:hypothetical protein